jgi:hypothetical protein
MVRLRLLVMLKLRLRSGCYDEEGVGIFWGGLKGIMSKAGLLVHSCS